MAVRIWRVNTTATPRVLHEALSVEEILAMEMTCIVLTDFFPFSPRDNATTSMQHIIKRDKKRKFFVVYSVYDVALGSEDFKPEIARNTARLL